MTALARMVPGVRLPDRTLPPSLAAAQSARYVAAQGLRALIAELEQPDTAWEQALARQTYIRCERDRSRARLVTEAAFRLAVHRAVQRRAETDRARARLASIDYRYDMTPGWDTAVSDALEITGGGVR